MAVYLAVAVSAVLPVLMSGRSPQRLPAAGWRSRRSHAAGAPQMMQFDELGERWTASGGSSIGVLLLSVGSPETPDDVEEYLYNVFCDPEIVTLPQSIGFFKKPLAWFIARARAAESRAAMIQAGGISPQVAASPHPQRAGPARLSHRSGPALAQHSGPDSLLDPSSPEPPAPKPTCTGCVPAPAAEAHPAAHPAPAAQVATVRAQADALQATLRERGVDATLFIAMRYWRPFAEEAVAQMTAQNVTRLVILPLYPHFSISTSGSALRVLERMLYTTPGFPMKSTVVPSWFNRKGYVRASARAIERSLASLPAEERAGAHVLYSAQGLPRKYVENLGDPYQGQVERGVALLAAELRSRGIENRHTLSYQGQVGPAAVPWTEPSTVDVIASLGAKGTRALLVVPVSFVFEHMGTLNEMDREYATLAAECGIRSFVRVPTLDTDPAFIDALASVVQEALPDLNQPSMQIINQGEPVALNVVNEYVTLYTKDQLQLVPQERPWGFTEQAEVVNGRLAMAAITLSVALSVDPSLKALVAVYDASKTAVAP